MSDKEILEKAIQKAISNGYKLNGVFVSCDLETLSVHWQKETGSRLGYWQHLYDLIYRHDFAKSLWSKSGKAEMCYLCPIHWRLFKKEPLSTTTAELTEWQYHLQQMVIADDPIKYLGENL